MAPKRTYQSATECPDIPFPDQVEGWVRFAVSSNGGGLDTAGSILSDPREIMSLRDYSEACIGTSVTETDIVAAINRITTSLQVPKDGEAR